MEHSRTGSSLHRLQTPPLWLILTFFFFFFFLYPAASIDMENEGKDWMWLPRDWRPTLADEFQAWDDFLGPAFIPLTLGISFSLSL